MIGGCGVGIVVDAGLGALGVGATLLTVVSAADAVAIASAGERCAITIGSFVADSAGG